MTPDYAKDICRIALKPHEFDSKMLTEALRYAFDALCTMRTANQLDALLEELRAELSEDA